MFEDIGIELSGAFSEQIDRIFIQLILLPFDVNLPAFEIDVIPL